MGFSPPHHHLADVATAVLLSSLSASHDIMSVTAPVDVTTAVVLSSLSASPAIISVTAPAVATVTVLLLLIVVLPLFLLQDRR